MDRKYSRKKKHNNNKNGNGISSSRISLVHTDGTPQHFSAEVLEADEEIEVEIEVVTEADDEAFPAGGDGVKVDEVGEAGGMDIEQGDGRGGGLRGVGAVEGLGEDPERIGLAIRPRFLQSFEQA